MKFVSVVLLVLLPVAASAAAASPEDTYIAARDQHVAKLTELDKPSDTPAGTPDERMQKAEEAARADLEQQLRKIIGRVAVKGFDGDGKLNIDSLTPGYEGFGKLDSLAFTSQDGKA